MLQEKVLLYRLDAAAAVEGRGGASDLQREVAAATLAAELPSSPGGSFPAVFGQWLALGLLSRRRVAALAEEAVQVSASVCLHKVLLSSQRASHV